MLISSQPEIDYNEEYTEGLLYATHKYGLIDRVAVPPDSKEADLEDLRLYLEDGESEQNIELSEILEGEKSNLEDVREALENEYGNLDLNLAPNYGGLEGKVYERREFGRKKWIWGYGQAYFHEQKERMAKRSCELSDIGEREKAKELEKEYDKDFYKIYGTYASASIGAMAAGAAFNNLPLLLGGLSIIFLGHSYGEMWQGMQIEERLEKPEFQTVEG